MIRATVMKTVVDALSSHPYLACEDFLLAPYKNKDGDPCLSITYRYDEQFSFKFHVPKAKQPRPGTNAYFYYFSCTVAPGREAAEEIITAEERTGLTAEINDWLRCLHEDVLSMPMRQFEVHSSAIEELRQRLDGLPNAPISKEDISLFREGLEQVKIELGAQLGREVEDKEELKIKVAELERDIEFLRQSLDAMSKRNWSEAFIVRVQKWKDKFGLRQLAAGGRVLQLLPLPPGVSTGLDAMANVADGVADILEKTKSATGGE